MNSIARQRWTPADATRSLTCERCGMAFGCTNTGAAGSCWCSEADYRLPVPLPPNVGPYADCLCPACMAAVAAELRAAEDSGVAPIE
jgi:hypothetical protein